MNDAIIEAGGARRGERRRAILNAARDLFVENGFERTSLDAIIARTGGSRRNIYDLFGNKEGLFEAVMIDQLEAVLTRAHVPDAPALGQGLREQLVTLGLAFMEGLLRPSVMQTLRQFVVAAGERPELGRQAYASGPEVFYGRIEAYLRAMDDRGDLDLPDIALAARCFTEMLKGGLEFRALLTGECEVTPAQVDRQVRGAVDLFLRGAVPR